MMRVVNLRKKLNWYLSIPLLPEVVPDIDANPAGPDLAGGRPGAQAGA